MQKSKLQFKIQTLGLFAAIFVFSFLLLNGSKANAAELFFEAKNQEFARGEEFVVNVFLNTEEESINAVEIRIVFPEELLEIKEIRDGNSIINFWVEKSRVEQPGAIIFSGITPGGYQEAQGFLLSVIFRAKSSGNGTIEIREAKVLLNDGKGTPASLKTSPFQFLISQEVPVTPPVVKIMEDTDPPEEFMPEIAQSPEMFDGKYFLVFATQDKNSGIDHYELKEQREFKVLNFEFGIKKGKFEIAESPYQLKDQKLRSFIYVKAVDKVGNERIAVLEPRYPIKWYENWVIWSIIILVIIFTCIFIKRNLWKKQ